MSDVDLRSRVLLCMQAALLGNVAAKMRAVAVTWTGTSVSFRVLVDAPLSSVDTELTSEIETEMIAHFPGWEVRGEASASAGPMVLAEGEVLVFTRAPQ